MKCCPRGCVNAYPPAEWPNLDAQKREVKIDFINNCLGLDLDSDKVATLLSRMALDASASSSGEAVTVSIPPTRSDILHDADVMEVCH